MTNLPPSFRTELAARFSLRSVEPLRISGRAGSTQKILVALKDGEAVEEVLIPGGTPHPQRCAQEKSRTRRTVCVSSQVGCRFACVFCASGKAGFRRNLEPGEMVGQVLVAGRVWGARPTHVVFMGIGEPLDNYDAVLKAVRIINDAHGLGIGARHITISTSGIIPAIRKLAQENLQIELSVSLHAANQKLRARLMPIARRYPLQELMQACADYVATTKRIITFEYTLIRDANDSEEHARELAGLLARLPSRVNLIPLSVVPEFPGQPAPHERIESFRKALSRAGINVTLRRSRGCSFNAACGQLRAFHLTDTNQTRLIASR